MPVCLLSSFLIAPRVGHMEQAIHCFAYLKKYSRFKMAFDYTVPSFDDSSFSRRGDRSAFSPEAAEPILEAIWLSILPHAHIHICEAALKAHIS